MPVKDLALALWRRVLSIVVQAGFANRDYLGRARQLGDRLEVRSGGRRGRIGMDADAGARAWQPMGELDGGATAGQVVADQHQPSHARRAGPRQDCVAIGVKGGVHQVRVRIE